MPAAPQHYRLYVLDQQGHRITSEWIQAGTDLEAVRFAQAMKKPLDCELWQQDRFVAKIESNGI